MYLPAIGRSVYGTDIWCFDEKKYYHNQESESTSTGIYVNVFNNDSNEKAYSISYDFIFAAKSNCFYNSYEIKQMIPEKYYASVELPFTTINDTIQIIKQKYVF